jgi:hypothetical protein
LYPFYESIVILSKQVFLGTECGVIANLYFEEIGVQKASTTIRPMELYCSKYLHSRLAFD